MSTTIGVISLTLSAFLISVINRFFLKRNFIDKINDRSSHSVTATRSGGIAIFISIFLVSFTCYTLGITLFDYSILIPIGLLVAIGLYDDIYNVDFKLKFIFQIIAAKIIIDTGLLIDNFHGVFGIFEINRIIAQLLTIFIIIAIINAINFIDGIDGLATSILLFFLISFEYFSLSFNYLTNFSLLTIAAVIPIYYYNFKNSNKVFLGDSGSHMMGGIVSIYVVFILSQDYIIKQEFDLHKILFVFSILSYPIIDIIRVIIIRRLKNKSIFDADKGHIHHLILKKFKSHLITTSTIILFSFFIMIIIQLLKNYL